MKESATIQYRCEDADTNLVETIPIASIGIDQWSQGHPVLFNLDRRGHHGRRMLSVLITACEAVLHEIQDIKWEDCPMAEPIDLVQQALNALADAGLGNDSPAEAFVIGYQAGWQEALDLCIRIETAINNETGETNEHHQR